MKLCCHHRRVTQRKPSPKTQSRLRGLPSQRNMQQRKRNTFFPQRARQPKQEGTRRTLNSIFKAYIAALRDAKKLAVSSGTTLAQKSRTGEDSALFLPSTEFQPSKAILSSDRMQLLRSALIFLSPKRPFRSSPVPSTPQRRKRNLTKTPALQGELRSLPKKNFIFSICCTSVFLDCNT